MKTKFIVVEYAREPMRVVDNPNLEEIKAEVLSEDAVGEPVWKPCPVPPTGPLLAAVIAKFGEEA